MRDINNVFIIGRFTRDPEMKVTANGKTLANFSVAVNHQKDQVSFINCTAWGKTAEIIAEYCKKGMQVAIEGYLQQNRWKDQSGGNRSDVQIVVNTLQFLGSKGQSAENAVEARTGPENQSEGEFDESSLPSGNPFL